MVPLCPTNHSSPLKKSKNEMEAAFRTSSLDAKYMKENKLPVSDMHLAVCKENKRHHLTKHRSEKRKFADAINGDECKSPKRTCRDYTGTSESIATEDADAALLLKYMKQKIRGEILESCEVVFTKVSGWEPLWQVAMQLGANCSRNIHSRATHILDSNFSDRNQWEIRNAIFLVHPHWVQAAQYLWRPREDGFLPPPVHAN